MDLYPFQDEAVAFLGMDGGIVADPPGAGKTATTLGWLRQRWEPGELIALVVPKVQIAHWRAEAAEWWPDLNIVTLTGTPKRRAESITSAGRASGEGTPTALLMTYETFRNDHEALAKPLHCGIIVYDEAHRLKNRNAKVTKAATKVARSASSHCLLTGTPVMNRAEELWSLLRLLDPKVYTSFWRWVHYYFDVEVTTFGYRQSTPVTLIKGVKPEKLEELRAEVAPYMIRRSLDDILDLPPLIHSRIPVELSATERKAYDQMAKHAWMEIDGQITQGENEVAKQVRLRQLASEWGVFMDSDKVSLGAKGTAAVALAEDLLEAGEQVVILCAYKETANRIAASLPGAALYTGDINQRHRDGILFDFREGDKRVVVGTLATMGEGVNGLQVAHHLIMVDHDWTPARNEQAIGRLLRNGQEHPVTVHHIYAENTIDQDVAEACIRKEHIIKETIG